jgi:hypothetical protein
MRKTSVAFLLAFVALAGNALADVRLPGIISTCNDFFRVPGLLAVR